MLAMPGATRWTAAMKEQLISQFKTFLLALKGLKLKDLFTELRFEISSFRDPVKNMTL